jgi:hypothetical protein
MLDPNDTAQSSVSRRNFLTGGLAIAAAISVSTAGRRVKSARRNYHSQPQKGNRDDYNHCQGRN